MTLWARCSSHLSFTSTICAAIWSTNPVGGDIDTNCAIDGTLVEVGSLGVAPSDIAGMDIAGVDLAFASLNTGSQSGLYSIDLNNGAANDLGAIGALENVSDLAVLTPQLADLIFGS